MEVVVESTMFGVEWSKWVVLALVCMLDAVG